MPSSGLPRFAALRGCVFRCLTLVLSLPRLPARVATADHPLPDSIGSFIRGLRVHSNPPNRPDKKPGKKNGPVGKPARTCSGTGSSGIGRCLTRPDPPKQPRGAGGLRSGCGFIRIGPRGNDRKVAGVWGRSLSAQGPELDLFRDFPCREIAQLLQHASHRSAASP